MSLLRAENLRIERAGRVLCSGLDVDFEAGQNWVILGRNGSGKTTLLHTLAGLLTPRDGRVLMDGHDLAAVPGRERARRLAVLFQDAELGFPATVRDTVLAGRHPYRGSGWLSGWRADRPADLAIATHWIEELALSGMSDRSVTQLSGGEQRRVALAALLTQDTAINLLDEPTNHLDLHHQTRILTRLSARVDRTRVNVMVLHDINLALRYCTHGLLLTDDRHLHGPLAEILNTDVLEHVYGCRISVVDDGRRRVFLPA